MKPKSDAAGGLEQVDRKPLRGIPQPPKCPRYGDDWANSSAGFNPKGPNINELMNSWPYRGPGR